MRALHLTGALALAAGLALTACGSRDTMSASTAMPASGMEQMSMAPMTMSPSGDRMTATPGMFEGLNGKKAAGKATVAGSMIELSDFSVDEGPDLHLYLTKGTSDADVKSGMRLGAVAYDKATQTFTLPAGVTPSSYSHLVVYCDKAHAVFGAASINS